MDKKSGNIIIKARQTLKSVWGYDSFRTGQEEIISSVLEGHDTLAILPTGGGKSICFQVPGIMLPGIAIVVTPLIALMKDQVENLNSRGIKALAVHSGMSYQDVEITLSNAVNGDFKFLYLSPERLKTSLFISYLQYMEVSMLVVDEAHCVCQWGYDFRPNYMAISEIREYIPDAPVLALTATATPTVAKDITEKLGFRPGHNLIKTSFERKNLSYIARKCEDKIGEIFNILNGVPGTSIIYARSRAKCEEISAILAANGVDCDFYHAGLSHALREQKQEDWKAGKIRVIVCTNAFGMGIDKRDVRSVIHIDLPDAPEAYFQEAGRAGRDGLTSYAVLLYNDNDISKLRKQALASFPSLDYIEKVYHAILSEQEIVYDTGQFHTFKFDLKKFGSEHGLSFSDLAAAVKYIEKAGHWVYEEERQIQTRVRLAFEREDLYQITFPSKRAMDLVNLLMRKYPEIYSSLVYIDEDFICHLMGITQAELRKTLFILSSYHYIRYIPQSESATITLLVNRLAPKNVNLDVRKYHFLKSSQTERCERMIEYVSRENECRTKYLLEYFGEEKAKDCGKCDICRSKKKAARK